MSGPAGVRVLLVIDHLGSGGAQAIVRDIAALQGDGFTIHVCFLFGSPESGEALRGAGVPVTFLGSRRVHLGSWLSGVLPVRMALLARRFQPDVVHAHAYNLPVYLAWVAGLAWRRSRRVFSMHANLWQIAPLWQRMLTTLLPRYDRVVTEFAGSREEVRSIGVREERIEHIPFGACLREVDPLEVAAARSECGVSAADPILLSVARLDHDRLLDRYIAMLPDVLARLPRARLVLIGDGALETELRRQARMLGVEDHVVFLGRRADPAPFYHACDLYLSVTVAGSCEVGIAGWQAMLARRPVVAIDPEPAETPLGCDHLVRVTEGELASAVVELMESPLARERLSAAGFAHADRHHTSAAMVARHRRLYRELALQVRSGNNQPRESLDEL